MKTKFIDANGTPIKGREILITLAVLFKNEWNRIYLAIKEKTMLEPRHFLLAKSMYKGKVITIIDEDYPEVFKKFPFPPFVLFYDHADRIKIGDESSLAAIESIPALEIELKNISKGGN